MLQTCRILVSAARPVAIVGITLALGAALLAGCGQPGVLYLPNEPAAAKRATLPQSLWPVMPAKGDAENKTSSSGTDKAATTPTQPGKNQASPDAATPAQTTRP